jgi:tetratricopeptide (TPR) repeat protein
MKTNHITLSQKLLSIILLALFVLPIYGQTEKPLSEFEQHKDFPVLQNNINSYEKGKDSGLYDVALKLAEKILTQTESIYGKEHEAVAKSYHRIGSILKEKGDYDKALGWHNKGYALNLKLSGEDSVTTARSFFHLGETHIYKGEYLKAKEFLYKAYTIQKKKLGLEHTDIADTMDELGGLCYYEGDYEKGIEYCNEVLNIRLKALNENHKDVATSYNNLGLGYDSKGEYDKAIEYYTKSLAIRLKTFGGDHPDVATSYNNLGTVYDSKGEYDKAIEYYIKDLAISIKTLGGEHPSVATSYNNLGAVYDSKGEYDKAIEYYTKSLSIRLKTFGEEHPDVATSYNNLGQAYREKGEYDKAIEYYTKSLAIDKKTLGCEHPYIALSYWNIGAAYKSQKSYPKSIEYLQKAIHIYEKTEERDQYILAYTTLKEVYVEQKQTDMAIHALKQAMELVLKFRTEMGRDKDAFTERFLFVFKDLLKLYLESEQLEKALEVSEKMRGLSISENFNLKYALSHGGVSQDAGEKLLKLKSELESLGSERIAAKRLGDKGKQREEELWKRIRTIEQEANTLDKELIRTMPIYAQLRKMESPTITALQRQLKKSNKTFLEYSLFTNKSGKESLHAFVISPKGFESVDLGKDLDITRRVNNLRLIISQYPDKRTFIALKRNDGALVLADARQCKGFHKGEKCSKFITDYESKPDENGNFKLKEVILGIQDRKVERKRISPLDEAIFQRNL